MTKKCPICGSAFIPKFQGQHFCSTTCAYEYNDYTISAIGIDCECAECGKKFHTEEYRRFCSTECRERSMQRDATNPVEIRRRQMRMDSLDKTLEYCKRMGLTYAQYQSMQTLGMLKEKENGQSGSDD